MTISSTPLAAIHFMLNETKHFSRVQLSVGSITLADSVTVEAIRLVEQNVSKGATTTSPATQSTRHLVFLTQPANVSPGTSLKTIQVQLLDSAGNLVTNAEQTVTLRLRPSSNSGELIGRLTAVPVDGVAIFNDVSISGPGAGYQLQVVADESTTAYSAEFSVNPIGSSALFVLPQANACQSTYDTFYANEPGVYAYWPLCEAGVMPALYDYVGRYDWSAANHAWSSRGMTIVGNVSGPVADGEGAARVATQSSYYANQDIVLNTHAGTLAVWANTDSEAGFEAMLSFEAVKGRSVVSVGATTPGSSECFEAHWVSASGVTAKTVPACGFVSNTWHRVVMTWSNGTLKFYVDGTAQAVATYSGSLDNKVFVYRLFPQGGNNNKQMTLAKAAISNQAWSPAQVAIDAAPVLVKPPTGGVYVTSQQLGTVHRDVLGYGDQQTLQSVAAQSALISGLKTAGVTSVRYANGSSGIEADLNAWQGRTNSLACTFVRGKTQAPLNAASLDSTDTYVPAVAQPLGLSMGYTVNYGTNPPLCNAGGDPITNGADLVHYLNKTRKYGFKYFEIGNELYNGGGSETDLHPMPAHGASYSKYEAEFAVRMKAVDPAIKIGIPVGMDRVYSWLADWTLPAMAAAHYDAAIYHSYPVVDPVTDGSTLYPERVASNGGPVKGDLLSLQTILLNEGKPSDAIWVTEWNGNSNGGGRWSRQTLGGASPLFAAMWLGEYMNAGVQWATWYAQYGSVNYCNPYNYDLQAETAYSWIDGCSGSFLVYTGSVPGETVVGFKAGDLSPVGRSFQLLSESGFVAEGEHMLRTVSDTVAAPWLLTYAATHGQGYALILINRDWDLSHAVPVQFPGGSAGSFAQLWSYGRAQYDQSYFGNWSVGPTQSTLPAWSGSITVTLPPLSVSVLILGK